MLELYLIMNKKLISFIFGLKSDRKAPVFFAFLILISAIIMTPLFQSYSDFSYRLLYSLSLPARNNTEVMLAAIDDTNIGNLGHYPLNFRDYENIIKTAYLFGAEKIGVTTVFPGVPQTRYNNTVIDELLSGNEISSADFMNIRPAVFPSEDDLSEQIDNVHFSYILTERPNYKNSLFRNAREPLAENQEFITLNETLNSFAVFDSYTEGSPFFETELYRFIFPKKEVDHLALTMLPSTQNINYTPFAVNATDNLNNVIFRLFTRHPRPYFFDTLLQKDAVIRIKPSLLMSYNDLLYRKKKAFAVLTSYNEDAVLSETTDMLYMLYQTNWLPNHAEVKILKEAKKEFTKHERSLILRSRSLLKKGTLSSIERETVEEAISEIESVNMLSSELHKLDGRVLFVDNSYFTSASRTGSPRFFSNTAFTPGSKAAYLSASIANNREFFETGFLINVFLSFSLSLFLMIVYYRWKEKITFKNAALTTGTIILFQYLVFNILHIHINPFALHFILAVYILLNFNRAHIFTVIRNLVQYHIAVNLSPESSPRVILTHPSAAHQSYKKHMSTLFYVRFSGLETIEDQVSPRFYMTLIQRIHQTTVSISNQSGGLIAEKSDNAFLICFSEYTGCRDTQVKALAAAELLIEYIREINRALKKKDAAITPISIQISMDVDQISYIKQRHYNIRSILCSGKGIPVVKRLSGINREYGTNIVLSENFRKHYPTAPYRLLDKIKIAQYNYSTVLYEYNPNLSDSFLNTYNEAHKTFYQKKFPDARKLFKDALKLHKDDGPSQLFLKRAGYYLRNEQPLRRTIEVG